MKKSKPIKILLVILPFVIAIIATFIYSLNFNGEFLFDDTSYFINNKMITTLSPFDFSAIFLSATNYWGELLPLRDFLYIVQYKLFGTSTTGYHIFSMFLFLCSAFVLFFWVRRIVKDYIDNSEKEYSTSLLPWLIASVIFSVYILHPVYVECVTYISGQKDILSVLFILLSLKYLYQAGRQNSNIILCLILGILFHYFAILSKLSALSTIIFVPVMLWLTGNRPGKELLKMTGVWILANIPVLLWLFHSISISEPYVQTNLALPFLERIPRALNVIGSHISHAFWPWPLSFGYQFDNFWKFDLNFILGTLFLLAMGFFFFKKRRSLITLGLLLFIIYLLPVLNILPDMPNEKIYNRYLALPMVGLILIILPVILTILKKGMYLKIVFFALLIGILTVFGVITKKYVPTFNSLLDASEHTYKYYPDWDKSSFYYVNSLINEKKLDRAKLLIKYEVRLNEIDWCRNYLLGRISYVSYEFDSAFTYLLQSSIQCKNDGIRPYPDILLASIYIMRGNFHEARILLNYVLNHNHKDPSWTYEARTLLFEIDQLEKQASIKNRLTQ